MKRISLLRHAQAVERTPALKDIDRPLTARGREDAALMGAFIARADHRPDLALCSPSARTHETLGGVCAALPAPPHIVVSDAVYEATAADLVEATQALPDQYGHVLIVGHNPSFHEFALDLAAPDKGDLMQRLRNKFPKAALAEFALDVAAWREIDFGVGRLVNFTRPKDLR